MFKILLSIYVSFLALTSYSQFPPELQGPSDVVIEDPNRVITEFSSRITDNSKIILSWIVTGRLPRYFAVERSDNGKSYEVISVLSNLIAQSIFQWTDDVPSKGKSFY